MNFDEHKKSADKFMTKDYQAMVKNLNEISKQFLNAKWYFLLTISALGLAYKYILLHPKHVFLLNPTNLIYSVIEANPSKGKIYSFTVFFVCLIGNIIFWLIGEYAVSHGFLFRTIQTRMARISKEFEDDSLRTRDPSHSSNFFENKDLKIEYFIPDQFLPFYWVGTWMILLNTILAAFLELQKNPAFNTSFIVEVLIFTLISLPFIWKLWMYYIYKMKKFIQKEYKSGEEKNQLLEFFNFPKECNCVGVLMGLIFFALFAVLYQLRTNYFLFVSTMALFLTIGYFLPLLSGLVIFILRNVLNIEIKPKKFPIGECICNSCHRLCLLLLLIF